MADWFGDLCNLFHESAIAAKLRGHDLGKFGETGQPSSRIALSGRLSRLAAVYLTADYKSYLDAHIIPVWINRSFHERVVLTLKPACDKRLTMVLWL